MDIRVSDARTRFDASALDLPPGFSPFHYSPTFQSYKHCRMDTRSVYTIGTYYPDESHHGPDTRGQTQKALMNFILEFHIDNTFIYR